MNDQDTDFVELLRTNSLAQMAIVKALLEGAEIPHFVHDNLSGLAGTGMGFVIKVPKDRMEDAKAVLSDLDSQEPVDLSETSEPPAS